jgi:hemerythrin-like domain-containing protein
VKTIKEANMSEMRPTKILEEEHHYSQKVVAALAVLLETLEAGKELEKKTLREVVEFMRTFANKCHHGKDETHLLPALEKKGVAMGSGLALYYSGSCCRFPLWPAPYESNTPALFIM